MAISQQEPKRGRGRPRLLTKEAVLAAASKIDEADGLDALSMPRLARELGIAPMTIYGYVENKQELLDDLVDFMLSDTPAIAIDQAIPWRRRIATIIKGHRRYLLKRPDLARLFATKQITPRAGLAWTRAVLDQLERVLDGLESFAENKDNRD